METTTSVVHSWGSLYSSGFPKGRARCGAARRGLDRQDGTVDCPLCLGMLAERKAKMLSGATRIRALPEAKLRPSAIRMLTALANEHSKLKQPQWNHPEFTKWLKEHHPDYIRWEWID